MTEYVSILKFCEIKQAYFDQGYCVQRLCGFSSCNPRIGRPKKKVKKKVKPKLNPIRKKIKVVKPQKVTKLRISKVKKPRDFNRRVFSLLDSDSKLSVDQLCLKLGLDPTEKQKRSYVGRLRREKLGYSLLPETATSKVFAILDRDPALSAEKTLELSKKFHVSRSQIYKIQRAWKKGKLKI